MNIGQFQIDKTSEGSRARAGKLTLANAILETPAFMPVGTAGTVKAMDPAEVASIGYRIILGNAFHLEMRPGAAHVARMGGLRKFMGWEGAILTDSGGYQVFSLATLRKITEEGVDFRSPIDGAAHFFSPERSMQIQRDLGSDVVMAFDECIPYPSDIQYARKSTERTLRWLDRCKAAPLDEGQLLFGIAQGGMHPELRRVSALETVSRDLPGHAIGGLSVGEPKPMMLEMLEISATNLPPGKPVYCMGIGTPEDFVACIDMGVDMFDCVQPTRHARNGQLFTRQGTINVKNAQYREDPGPADSQCGCPMCRRFSMSYMRHLFVAREILAMRLMTWHNLQFFRDFTQACRSAILEGRWAQFREGWREGWRVDAPASEPGTAPGESGRISDV